MKILMAEDDAVSAKLLELSLRQSLAMSAGDWSIFVTRPISAVMLGVGLLLVLGALKPLVTRRRDWRAEIGLDEPKA